MSTYSSYLLQKAGGDSILTHIPKLDVVFSGGGISGMYQLGVIAYLSSHLKPTQIDRHYGTSVGSASAVFSALMAADPSFSIDKVMEYINAKFKDEFNRENSYIINAWRNMQRDLLPENIHEICTDKVFITITVIENFRLKHKVISRFFSKEHLLDVVHTSMSIPFLTIPGLWKSYYCPFDKHTFKAVDGVFNAAASAHRRNNHPTLFVNVVWHNYPFVKRLHLFETSYDSFVVDGMRDVNLFCKGLKSQSSYMISLSLGVTDSYRWLISSHTLTSVTTALLLCVALWVLSHNI